MKAFLSWWYRVSLPKKATADTSPAQREKTRYARLTTAFTLLLFILTALLTPWSVFDSYNPASAHQHLCRSAAYRNQLRL